MDKTTVLANLFREFGDKAQDALDFIANETNRRKLTWLENHQTQTPAGSVNFNVNVTSATGSIEPQFLIALEGGEYIDKDEWVANPNHYSKDDVIGIAVRTQLTSFIVSLKQWKKRWSEDTEHCITDKHNEARAIQVLSGLEHTRQLVEAQEDEGDTAAKLCWNYGHKGLQWYMPCLLELNVVCANKEEINELLKLVGGDPLSLDECYWSSTELSALSSWFVNFGSGNSGNGLKYVAGVVRPAVAI